MNNTEFRWLGTVDYEEAHQLQLRLWQKVLQTNTTQIIGLEHPEVITLGRRAQRDQDIKELEFPHIVQTDRGGQATLHSPGQLVIYPIAPVRDYGGLRKFVDLLLECTRLVLLNNSIPAEAKPDCPGLYTTRGKICFIGLRVEKGVSRHGLSLNVENNLNLFQAIRSCGVNEAAVDSVKKWGQPVQTQELFSQWASQWNVLLSDTAPTL